MSTALARRAVASIGPCTRVVVGPGCGTPTTLVHALVEAATDGRARGARVSSGLLIDDQGLFDAAARGDVRYDTWHPMGAARGLIDRGVAGYLPMRSSSVPGHLARTKPDVALVRVSPPDRHGFVSLGASVSYSRSAVDHAAVVLGEVDPAVPRTGPASLVPVDRFTALVETASPMPAYVGARPSAVADQIADHILGLLPDSPALQVGIGAVPEALTARLAEVGGTFRFVGMGSDAMVGLAESGRLDGDVASGLAIAAVELMGTQRLMEFADDNPLIGVLPSTVGQFVPHLAGHERLVSVNSGVQLDLTGQVASESVGGRQISGIGGSHDFVEAAHASVGGLVIVALTSTARDASRIVTRLGPDAPVTIPRHSVDVVVTEWGVADLRGRSVADRAEALIAVAHPDHRDALACNPEPGWPCEVVL